MFQQYIPLGKNPNFNSVQNSAVKDSDKMNNAFSIYLNNKKKNYIKLSPMNKKNERKFKSYPPLLSKFQLPPNFDVIEDILYSNKDDNYVKKHVTHVKYPEEDNESESNEPSSINNSSGTDDVFASNFNLFEPNFSEYNNTCSHISLSSNVVSEYYDKYLLSNNDDNSRSNNKASPKPNPDLSK